jgi:hypothetical protein
MTFIIFYHPINVIYHKNLSNWFGASAAGQQIYYLSYFYHILIFHIIFNILFSNIFF